MILEQNSVSNVDDEIQTNKLITSTPLVDENSTHLTAHPTISFNLNEAHPTVSFLNSECKVDLVFVIDTSQSVSEEFEKQLKFAVDLVSNNIAKIYKNNLV